MNTHIKHNLFSESLEALCNEIRSTRLPEHFERWKTLFVKNMDELFEGDVANEGKTRANSIAYLMQNKIEGMRNKNN